MRNRGNGGEESPPRSVLVRLRAVAAVVLVSLALPVVLGSAAGVPSPIEPAGDSFDVGTTDVGFDASAQQQAQPTAALEATPDPAHPSETVTLDASASSSPNGEVVGCDFDFEGDGNYDVFGDDDCVVTHDYAAGSYQPTVRVRDVDQFTDTASTTLTVEQNQPPDAAFQPSPTDTSVDEPVTFDATDSDDPDGTIVEYRWDFDGDGIVDEETTDSTTQHAYDEPGSYAVILEVEDDDGATDEAVFQVITVAANQPPTARFEYSPGEPSVGESTTFDASESSDSDGTIVAYRWDFDDDGVVDEETSAPTTQHAYGAAGTYVVTLVVEDDDGATDTAQDEAIVVGQTTSGGPVARCDLSPSSVAPGESVTLDASNSANAVSVAFDVDGDGTFDRTDESTFRTSTTYEPGTYSPRVRVTGPNGQTAVTDCGTVTVDGGNEPPVARFTHEPADPDVNTQVRFDASGSFDPDGTIVEYRWDFDVDGEVDAATAVPTVVHTYSDERVYTVVLEVEDDDGATDDTSNPVAVRADGTQGGGIQWQWGVLLLLGLLGGFGICRGLAWLRPFRSPPRIAVPPGSGVTDYAAGVFQLPADGGTVAVTDVGFEPGLVLLTASNAVVAGDATDQVRGTADGWSYGAARRTADGGVDQHVVAVADDARHPDQAVAAASGEGAVLLASDGGDGQVGGVVARVERTTADGFEVAVDGPERPTATNALDAYGGPTGDRPVVLYRAFELDSPGDVELGHVSSPTAPGPQSVDLDVPADHVTLTACNALSGLDASATSEGAIGVSVGEVVGPAEPRQLVTAGAIVPGAVETTRTAASDRLAVHLPVGDDGTRARVTGLDDGLELDYEAVAAGAESGASGDPVRGQPPGPALLTYVAMNAGDAVRPALGHFALPSPSAEEDLAVDTGFAPGMVELTVVDVDELGERTTTTGPFAFGRSHGVAVRGAGGEVAQYRLNGAIDPDRPVAEVDRSGGEAEVPGGMADDPAGEVLVAEAAAAGLAADGAGATITGRDDVAVTAFRPAGFDVRVTDVSTDGRDPNAGGDKLVCYKAWPRRDR